MKPGQKSQYRILKTGAVPTATEQRSEETTVPLPSTSPPSTALPSAPSSGPSNVASEEEADSEVDMERELLDLSKSFEDCGLKDVSFVLPSSQSSSSAGTMSGSGSISQDTERGAKYSTYSFQNDSAKEIVHFELVQVTEASSSVAMEVMGLQRGLSELLDRGVDIGVMTTDRSPSVRKLMREEHPTIQHELDSWHVTKGIKKNIVAASNRKGQKELFTWLKAITNHLYWSCDTSNGDQELCVRRWTSLLYHIIGVHRWEEGSSEHTCLHPPLSDEEQERKKWISPDSPAFSALKDIVTNRNLLHDLRQMTLFKHTGPLEAYHSVMLKYVPKRLHFNYDSIRARTQLAIMDHNENVGRQQATTKAGELRWSFPYSRQSGDWVSKPIYQKTTQTFRRTLIERALEMRDDASIAYTEQYKKPRCKRLLQNIAPVARPDKNFLVARRTSRFGGLRAKPY
ncbi:uncharacterized protein LOC134456062 [Engraulis encrasicolus]|uniref:uncharacterized protein LOC134456062 n=1 Tax=Engraulis encrasicolus TaxID=184585 RepID=UPI002FD71CA9